MKKYFFIALLLGCTLHTIAQASFTALEFAPQYPKAGDRVSFTYNASYSPLIKEKKVDVAVYLFNEKGNSWTVVEPTTTKAGNTYKFFVAIDGKTSGIGIKFSANDGAEKDLNSGKGYIIPIYGSDKLTTAMSYNMYSSMYSGMGNYLFGTAADADTSYYYLQQSMAKDPGQRYQPAFMNSYINATMRAKKKEAEPLVMDLLKAYGEKENATEEDYQTMKEWYGRLKHTTESDSLDKIIKERFPDGNWVKAQSIQKLMKEKDPDAKAELYNALVAKYPLTEENKAGYEFYASQIASGYSAANNWTAYSNWNSKISKASAAMSDNNVAWGLAQDGENMDMAKKLSLSATTFAKSELDKPSEKQPVTMTKAEWKKQRETNYAMFADTYAYIATQEKDYKTAYKYAKDAANIAKMEDANYNERYAVVLAKTEQPAIAVPIIEKMVKEGKATSVTKDALKELYVKQKKSEAGFDAYLTKLEAAAKEKRKAEIAKTMMNKPAPNFSLKDLDGKMVSLQDMKGKTVVVDFWATWCGPCVASMPAMNRALAKYKDNDNVKFLFVDTWQKEENKEKNARDFMEKKGYPFYVLMDNEDKMVTDFGVSGIPTKFIVDRNGIIRFTSVGFSGNDDLLVEEIETMIALAGNGN